MVGFVYAIIKRIINLKGTVTEKTLIMYFRCVYCWICHECLFGGRERVRSHGGFSDAENRPGNQSPSVRILDAYTVAPFQCPTQNLHRFHADSMSRSDVWRKTPPIARMKWQHC